MQNQTNEEQKAQTDFTRSVVKVRVTSARPDYKQPWMSKQVLSSAGKSNKHFIITRKRSRSSRCKNSA